MPSTFSATMTGSELRSQQKPSPNFLTFSMSHILSMFYAALYVLCLSVFWWDRKKVRGGSQGYIPNTPDTQLLFMLLVFNCFRCCRLSSLLLILVDSSLFVFGFAFPLRSSHEFPLLCSLKKTPMYSKLSTRLIPLAAFCFS